MWPFSYATTQFSYDYCRLEPAQASDSVQIRVLRLQPPPWYLRLLLPFLRFYIPLRASLFRIDLPSKPRDKDITEANPQTQDKEVPRYKALSYTWGPKSEVFSEIIVDGSTLAITPSLWAALVHLRPDAEPLDIWIDQICINQKDTDEKNTQVQHMGQIYRSAEEALVWLGPVADCSDDLMDVFIRMGNFADSFDLLNYYKPGRFEEFWKIVARDVPDDPKTREYHAFCDSMIPLFTHELIRSLIAFYWRPWFNRAWVLQEFSFAPKVAFICGQKTISAESLMVVRQMIQLTMASKVLEVSPQDRIMGGLIETLNEIDPLQPLLASRQRRKARDEGRIQGDGLYEILQRVHVDQSVQATEDCDMIFGVLALANDADSLGVRVDYGHKPEQVDGLYIRTARSLIESGKVDLLTLAQHMKRDVTLPSWVPDWRSEVRRSFAYNGGTEKVDFTAVALAQHLKAYGTLPSWVPDWRCEISRSFAWVRDETQSPLFSASAGLPLELTRDPDERLLTLAGFLVDELEEIGGPWTAWPAWTASSAPAARFPHESYVAYFAQVRFLCQLSKAKGADIYPSAERRDEAVWRVPVGDIEKDETFEAKRARPTWKTAYEQCVGQVELQMQWKAFTSLEEYKARAAQVGEDDEVMSLLARSNRASFYRIRMNEMKGKRPFLSKLGYVGMGPTYMSPGDVIAVFAGASLPFIVRPLGEGRFRLLGECYCDGIMDGEIVEKRPKEPIVLV